MGVRAAKASGMDLGRTCGPAGGGVGVGVGVGVVEVELSVATSLDVIILCAGKLRIYLTLRSEEVERSLRGMLVNILGRYVHRTWREAKHGLARTPKWGGVSWKLWNDTECEVGAGHSGELQ